MFLIFLLTYLLTYLHTHTHKSEKRFDSPNINTNTKVIPFFTKTTSTLLCVRISFLKTLMSSTLWMRSFCFDVFLAATPGCWSHACNNTERHEGHYCKVVSSSVTQTVFWHMVHRVFQKLAAIIWPTVT